MIIMTRPSANGSLYHHLTVRQNLQLYADLYGLDTDRGPDPLALRPHIDAPTWRW